MVIRVKAGLFKQDQIFEEVIPELQGAPTFLLVPLTDRLQRRHLLDRKSHRMPVTKTRAGEMRLEMQVEPDQQRERVLNLRREVVRGWRDWRDAEGADIPYTEANREVIIDQDDIADCLMEHAESLATAREEAAAGN